MRKSLAVMMMSCLLVGCGNDDLRSERDAANRRARLLIVLSVLLGTGCFASLVIGAAIGSSARSAAEEGPHHAKT